MQKSRSLVPDGMVAANAAGGGGGPARPAAGPTAPPADTRLVIGGRVVEIVTQLAPNDILLGRGAPIANYEGMAWCCR
jgi:hypothetical protein